MVEEWRPVKGYEGLYEVSNIGRVRNPRLHNRFLKPYKHPAGHLRVTLGRNVEHICLHCLVHRLVYESFVEPIPPGKVIRHLNGNPRDNRVANLALGTQQDNMRDIYAYGGKTGRGRLTNAQVITIRQRLMSGERQAALASEYQVSVQTISNIKTGRTFSYL